MTEGTKKQRLKACRAYVQAVLVYGDDLDIVFYPKWMNDGSGRAWFRRMLGYANNGKPEVPHCHDFTFDELLAVLEPLGKVRDLRDKMPWDYQENPGICTTEAILERLKKARQALGLDLAAFYAPTGLTPRTVEKWEAGKRRFVSAFGDKPIVALCNAHGINEFWLICGGKLPGDERKENASVEQQERVA
jgi:hypothetical protein